MDTPAAPIQHLVDDGILAVIAGADTTANALTMLFYCLLILGQAKATNIETLLVTRFLSGVFASAPLTNSGGVIADIWDAVGRGPASGVFSASVFVGPVLGPIVGGLYVQYTTTFSCRVLMLSIQRRAEPSGLAMGLLAYDDLCRCMLAYGLDLLT